MKKSSLLYKIINGIWDMCFIWKTEMRNVFRDEGVLIFCILVPLGYPLLYSWIYNNEVVREVDTAIVDLSHSHSSRKFILLNSTMLSVTILKVPSWLLELHIMTMVATTVN